MWHSVSPGPALSCAAEAPDTELLFRAAAGEHSAFALLFRRHRSSLRQFLYQRLRRHEDAEDAVTVTFCNAWSARHAFRGEASGKAWLYRIASRVAVDALRSRRARCAEVAWDSQPAYLLDAPDPAGDPVPLLLARETRAEMRAAVGRALAGLSPADRELLRLFYFEEHSYLEISALLSITPSQVRGRLHRVRGRVKAALEALEWVPSGVMK